MIFPASTVFFPQDAQTGSSRKGEQGAKEKNSSLEELQTSVPLFLQYPVPYTQDTPTPLLVSQSPSKLHFGNPYSILDSKGELPKSCIDGCSVHESVAPNRSPRR